MRNIIKSCATVLTAVSIQLLTAPYCAAQALPEADLMYIVFNADGTAQNVSPLHLTVDKDGAPVVTYNEKLGRNVAEFTHPWCVSSTGETNKGTTFYRVQYGDSPSFESALAEGFSVELLVKASGAPAESPDTESKAFSSTQGGGACIGVKVKEKDGMNGWNFFINVTPSGTKKGTWIFANTNIYPTPDKINGITSSEYGIKNISISISTENSLKPPKRKPRVNTHRATPNGGVSEQTRQVRKKVSPQAPIIFREPWQ